MIDSSDFFFKLVVPNTVYDTMADGLRVAPLSNKSPSKGE